MVIKYCPMCQGKPYTTDLSVRTCKICGCKLSAENIDEALLRSRSTLPDEKTAAKSFDTNSESNIQSASDFSDPLDPFDPFSNSNSTETETSNGYSSLGSSGVPVVREEKKETAVRRRETTSQRTCTSARNRSSGTVTIRGTVSQYSSTDGESGNYRRLLPSKLFQSIFYGQRFEDLLHRFTVSSTCSNNEFDQGRTEKTWVNVHGTIWGGMQIVDHSEVEVTGKYNRNGVLMASRIDVIDGGISSRIRFQHSVGAIFAGFLIMLLLGFTAFIGFSSDDFWGNIASFYTIYGIFFLILTVLFLIFRFSRIGLIISMGRRFSFVPFIIILILSFLLTIGYIQLAGGWAIL